MRAPRCIACLNWAVLFSVLSFSAAADSPRPEPLDTSYIAGDTAIVVVLHPQQFLTRQATLPSYIAQWLEVFKGLTGIDAKNLRQVVLQFGTDTTRDDGRNDLQNDALTGVFRFDKPIDADALAAKAFELDTKTTHKGQTYFQPRHADRTPAVWFPDNRTMIVANEWRVLRIIDEPHRMGMMVSRLRQADSSVDLLIEVDAVKGKPLLGQMFKGAPEEPVSPLKMIGKLDRVTVTGRLTAETPLAAQFHARDADAAEELKLQGEMLLKLARQSWSKQRDEIRQFAGEGDSELFDMLVGTVDTMLAGTTFSTEDNRLAVEVQKNGGSFDLVTLFFGVGSASASAAPKEAEARKAEAVREERAAKIKAEEAARRALEERQRNERQKQKDRP